MPQKDLKKDDGVRGRREKISSKFFFLLPRSQINLYWEQSLKNRIAQCGFSAHKKAFYGISVKKVKKLLKTGVEKSEK